MNNPENATANVVSTQVSVSTDHKSRLARLLLSAASGFAILATMGGVAHAQTATTTTTTVPAAAATPEEEKEETATGATEVVVVTGYRASLRNSISTKRRLDVIGEAISSEDVGKLPDNSIADALARLPGLSVQRLNGRGTTISIRGLGPDFNIGLLNGREQASTNDGRGVDFDQFPSELLAQVRVYKTPQAALMAQGIGGTVDLRTVRPLDQADRTIAINGRIETNEFDALIGGAETTGYRYNLTYIDQFMDDKFGIAIGVASMLSPQQFKRYRMYEMQNDVGARYPGGIVPLVQANELERKGVMGVMQYKPTDALSITLDAYQSKFDDVQRSNGLEAQFASWSNAVLSPTGRSIGDGYLNSGTFNNVVPVVRNDVFTRDATVSNIGLNVAYQLTERFSIEADAYINNVDRDDVYLESYSGTAFNSGGPNSPNGTSIGWNWDASGLPRLTSTVNYADFNTMRLTDPRGWGVGGVRDEGGGNFGQSGYYNARNVEDEIQGLRLAGKYDFAGDGAIKSVEFGVYRSERFKALTANEAFVNVGTANSTVVIPEAARLGVTTLPFGGLRVVSYDPLIALNAQRLLARSNSEVTAKSWRVDEEVTTLYTRLNIDTEFVGIPVTGNAGFQYIFSDQSSTGFAAIGSGAGQLVSPISGGKTFEDVLPSLNLAFEVSPDSVLRFAAGRTLMRSPMNEMRSSINFSYDPARANIANPGAGPWSGGSGNPEIEPYRATQIDLSYERYFARSAIFSVAAFHRNLETWQYGARILVDFTGVARPSGPAPATNLGFVDARLNGSGGWMKGVEVNLVLPFEVFTPALDGFGFSVNGYNNESKIITTGQTTPTSIPGLSKTGGSATVWFERWGFEARVSARYRGDFLGTIPGFGGAVDLETVEAETVVDAQIGYTFQEGFLEGFAVTLQANNLTDEPTKVIRNNDPRNIAFYQQYGANYLLGFRYKF